MSTTTRSGLFVIIACLWLALGWYGTTAGQTVVDAIWAKAEQGSAKSSKYAGQGDAELYRQIVKRVSTGEPYYAAATSEQRTRGYPTKPVFAVRLPTLATLFAWFGVGGMQVIALGVMIATIGAWSWRLRRAFPDRPIWLGVAVLIGLGSIALTSDAPLYFHEAWAGIFIALSLGLWAPGQYRASVIVALIAVLIRELALAYILGMLVLAVRDRRWKEVSWWAGAIIIFVLGMAIHAHTAMPYILPSDEMSPGWLAYSGWGFSLAGLNMVTSLTALPFAFTAFLIPLSLMCWYGWRSPLSLRVVMTLAGYLISFTVMGRTDNFYWGLMTAPLCLAGLMFLPQAVTAMLKSDTI